jgi:beta-phosphoglucomutase-like phosphatase (HAD superfamily)
VLHCSEARAKRARFLERGALEADEDVVGAEQLDPEGYLKALDLLGVDAPDVTVFEDTEAGIASARAAGIGRILAMTGTLDPGRLGEADELIDRIDVDVMRRCLS